MSEEKWEDIIFYGFCLVLVVVLSFLMTGCTTRQNEIRSLVRDREMLYCMLATPESFHDSTYSVVHASHLCRPGRWVWVDAK